MSSSNPSMNISPQNVTGKCNLKCSYAFKYSESSSTATNHGVMIKLSYDARSVPPVVYNEEKYHVSHILIVSPSMHLFNGATMPGEVLVEHVPVKGGNNLNVCIPLTSSTESSAASVLLTEIIKSVSSNAPSEGDSTNLKVSKLTLQTIVPRKPFFAYSTHRDDYIVFGALDAIPLSGSTISTLQQIIDPFPVPMPTAPLFYNSKGPVAGLQLGDGLYISCQPTGSSSEETAVEYDKPPSSSSSSVDFSNIVHSPTFAYVMMTIVGIVVCLLVFYGISVFYKYLSSDPPLSTFVKGGAKNPVVLGSIF